ncbi:MFS transporter [Streptomyces sp. NPDC047046]|uniref:MFS transporter n=1 Tax=Streptomyces sp. NPDC047046 TaxID=3155378 RepID=UPI0033FE0CC1
MSRTADPVPAEPADALPAGALRATSRRWWILALIGLAQLMVMLDSTIVNIALPSAQADLGFADGDRQWVITAYALAFGGLLLLGGRISDMFGRRRVFLTGLIGFALASALGGAAPSFGLLLTARALQGAFAALLAPSARSLLVTTFTEPRERAKAFGVFGGIAGAGGAIGLLLGGVLTQGFSWRWTLYVNVALALVALAGALRLLPREGRDRAVRLDVPGVLLVSSALFGLVYGLSDATSRTWGAPATWGPLTSGVLLLAAFTWWQTRATRPLLPLAILLDRTRAASYLTVLVSGAGVFGVFLFVTYYLQGTLGYSPTRTGLAFLPMVAVTMVVSVLASTSLLARFGPRPVVPLGLAVSAAGMAWMTALGTDSGYAAHLLPPLLLAGVGMGLSTAPAISLATYGVAPRDAGVSSAAVSTMQQIGGSVGTALFNTMATTAVTRYLTAHPARTPATLARANIHGYATAYWWAAGVFALGAVLTFALHRPGRLRAPEEERGA